GAHHAGNGAAGAHTWIWRVDVKKIMSDVCAQAAYQIKKKVTEVSQAVFHVVTEYRQPPHIQDQMQPARMHKHGAEKRYQRNVRGQATREPLIYMGGKKRVLCDECGLLPPVKRQFKKEYQSIENDQEIIDIGCGGTRSVITDREHFVEPALIMMLDKLELLKWTVF